MDSLQGQSDVSARAHRLTQLKTATEGSPRTHVRSGLVQRLPLPASLSVLVYGAGLAVPQTSINRAWQADINNGIQDAVNSLIPQDVDPAFTDYYRDLIHRLKATRDVLAHQPHQDQAAVGFLTALRNGIHGLLEQGRARVPGPAGLARNFYA